MKKITTWLAMILVLSIGFVDSAIASAYSNEKEFVNKQQEQYRIAQPIPYFDWSLERHLAIKLYEARNQKIATHTVWRAQLGRIEGDCPSIGYPLPYDVSLTNPLQPVNAYASSAVIAQPEPNGLYPSKNSISTWVICVYTVNGRTIETPIYIESIVTAYPYPVIVNYTTNRVKPAENVMPSVVIEYDSNATR